MEVRRHTAASSASPSTSPFALLEDNTSWRMPYQAGELYLNFARKIISFAWLESRSTNWPPLIPKISISGMAAPYVLQKCSTDIYLGSGRSTIADVEWRNSNCGEDGGMVVTMRYPNC
jgi:hypothetical protein